MLVTPDHHHAPTDMSLAVHVFTRPSCADSGRGRVCTCAEVESTRRASRRGRASGVRAVHADAGDRRAWRSRGRQRNARTRWPCGDDPATTDYIESAGLDMLTKPSPRLAGVFVDENRRSSPFTLSRLSTTRAKIRPPPFYRATHIQYICIARYIVIPRCPSVTRWRCIETTGRIELIRILHRVSQGDSAVSKRTGSLLPSGALSQTLNFADSRLCHHRVPCRRPFHAPSFTTRRIWCGRSATAKPLVYDFLHDLLLRSYLYHCVWSVITAHNLTPDKRDNNYLPHPLTPTSCLRNNIQLITGILPCCGCL